MNRLYMSAKDIQALDKRIPYREALKIVKVCQEQMTKDGKYIPRTQEKLASQEYVMKMLGLGK